MSAVGTATVSPDNPLRSASTLPFALPPFGDDRPRSTARGAARRHGRAAGRGRRDRRLGRAADLREHGRRAGTVGPAARRGRRRCSATSPRRCPRRGCGRSSGRSPRWRPRTPTRCGSTRRCSPGSTRCTPARHDAGLDDEAVRLVERYHLDFVLAGAQLDDAGRARLDRAQPGALDAVDDVRAEPAAGHRGRGRAGRRRRRAGRARRRGDRRPRPRPRPTAGVDGYLITLLLPTGQPVLTKLRNRDLRRRVFEASIARASAG